MASTFELGSEDVAVVIRKDSIELALPDGDENREATQLEILVTALAIRLANDESFVQDLYEWFIKNQDRLIKANSDGGVSG